MRKEMFISTCSNQPTNLAPVFSLQRKKHLLNIYSKPRKDTSRSLGVTQEHVVFVQQKLLGKMGSHKHGCPQKQVPGAAL
jgi:hypothetical protein